jgi:hypothetical protein
MSSRGYHEPVEDPSGEFMVRLFAEKSIARCERAQVSGPGIRLGETLSGFLVGRAIFTPESKSCTSLRPRCFSSRTTPTMPA